MLTKTRETRMRLDRVGHRRNRVLLRTSPNQATSVTIIPCTRVDADALLRRSFGFDVILFQAYLTLLMVVLVGSANLHIIDVQGRVFASHRIAAQFTKSRQLSVLKTLSYSSHSNLLRS
jgi:hypothetical protein